MNNNNHKSKQNAIPKTGSQITLDYLTKHGVDVVFGIPGGANLPLYDAMYKNKFRNILTRHEQGASHMADGYARSTGKIGCCMATSGPGATNLVTGLMTSKMDSTPVVAVTGQVPTHLIGTDAFQEADVYGISIPITKYNALVKTVDELPTVMEEALQIAVAKRPGPALVDIPKDVQNAETLNYKEAQPRYNEHHLKSPQVQGDLDALADAINQSEKPLLYVGGGVINSNTSHLLRELAEKANIPVTMTLMGIGSIPTQHYLSLGMLGMHGTAYANKATNECDIIISVGARFDDRVAGNIAKFAPQAKIVHFDIDESEISKLVPVDYYILGDLKDSLIALMPMLKKKERKPWFNMLNELKEKHPLKYKKESNIIKPQQFIERLSELTKGDIILTSDVGQHQMWVAQHYDFVHPRTHLTSGGLGTMGFGFPAAIGAKVANPNKLVMNISGDGGFQMNLQELATCAMYNVDVKVIVLNNGFLGMVRQWQELFFDNRFSAVDFEYNPNFALMAESFGLKGKQINSDSEIDKGIDFLLNSDGASLLEVVIPSEEKVYPMIPSGQSAQELIEFSEAK